MMQCDPNKSQVGKIMRVAIIGAGPSGLVAAHELVERGMEVHVFERDAQVGGLARTLHVLGERVELGPHFVVTQDQVPAEKTIFSYFEEQAQPYQRRSRIYLDGVYYEYPPRALDILRKWGIGRSFAAFLSLLWHRVLPGDRQPNAYNHVRRALGRTLCDAFFASYSEKLWGVPCDQIDESYARALIGFEKFSLGNLLTRLRSTGNAQFHQDCIYPKGGIGGAWERLKNAIEVRGGRFHMQASITSLTVEGHRVSGLVTADGREHVFDAVLSSAPDALMLRMLPQAPAHLLASLQDVRARKLALLYVKLRNTDVVPDHTVYLYSSGVRAVRASNFNRFRSVSGEGVVLLEYWLSPTDALCENVPALERIGLADLAEAFGVSQADVLGTHVTYIPAAYLVPDPGLAGIREAIRACLDGYEGLYRMGRGNQDLFNFGVVQSMRDGMVAAQRVASRDLHAGRRDGRLTA